VHARAYVRVRACMHPCVRACLGACARTDLLHLERGGGGGRERTGVLAALCKKELEGGNVCEGEK
jgi:hypothetical protein